MLASTKYSCYSNNGHTRAYVHRIAYICGVWIQSSHLHFAFKHIVLCVYVFVVVVPRYM